MSTKQETSTEIRKKLEQAKTKLAEAQALRSRLEQQLEMVKDEISNLNSIDRFSPKGRIQYLTNLLANAELRERQEALPLVRVKWNGQVSDQKYVVTMCGPKRIGLSRVGSERRDMYDKETGKAIGYGPTIHPEDLERIKREGK